MDPTVTISNPFFLSFLRIDAFKYESLLVYRLDSSVIFHFNECVFMLTRSMHNISCSYDLKLSINIRENVCSHNYFYKTDDDDNQN